MKRSINVALVVMLVALCQPDWIRADEVQLNRQDVTVIKKKMVEVEAALGQPPAGYGKAEESFNLPTSASTGDKGTGFYPVYSSAHFRFDGGSEKMAKKSEKEIEAEYRKKIMEAQASGNYEAMSKITEEMMQKATQAQMEAEDAKRDPVNVSLSMNSSPGATIDPDAVVFERPGVIALKAPYGGGDQLQVVIYFDPVRLKDTQSLSRIDLNDTTGQGVSQKTTVRNIVLEMTGPPEVVEEWSKKIATDKVLAQIDTK